MERNCRVCERRATDCAQGLMTLPLRDLLVWCRNTKKRAGITNAQISEMAGIPIGTLERTMSGRMDDAKFSTVQPIASALLDLAPEVPCPKQMQRHMEDLERTAESVGHLEQALSDMRAGHAKDLSDRDKRIAYFEEQLDAKDTHSKRLLRGLIGLGAFDIIILTLDLLIPTIGFFRY